VAAEIVHDHDVAGLQFGNEKLFDIGLEREAVDRPIEDHGRDHAADAQSCDERRGFPVSVRDADPQPLPFGARP